MNLLNLGLRISNIYYLGNPTELMWSDYNVKKGFHVFDTITRELDFKENLNKID